MNSKYVLFSIVTALVIVGIYQIFAIGEYNYPEYNLKAGQVAEAEIIAPFDFPVMKPEKELEIEKEKVIQQIAKPYFISDEPMFETLSDFDAIFALLASNAANPNDLAQALKRSGHTFNPENLSAFATPSLRDKTYENLRNKLSSLYQKGIYESLSSDSVLISSEDELKTVPITNFFSVESAREELIKTSESVKGFTAELAEQLIKPNLLVSEDKLNEISMSRLGAVPQSEGVVLQNEIIVRKNARITNEEMRKLNSLQRAYRDRNVHKSPLQETILTLGLLMFIFMVVSLANHYFCVMDKEAKLLVSDFIPLNLGFVVLALITTLVNQVLGYSNLVIPFAMFGISAAILVSFEYGMLYSICSSMVVAPFINWESYTTIILLLSSMACLLLIRRQNAWHEYLMIWIYMVISSVLVIVSISIYKNDNLISIVRSLGVGLISATTSIAGIIMVVPYYERKWNRATKQTLLELLDFNHPLLKKLATEAVGTYHHSLIVGNLTERAAEAIGANPLLARVGSYYHDIGKVIHTDIYTENNSESSVLHDSMIPTESANMIRDHVSEGIILAKKYKIPQPVIDIIMQHHGDSVIRYFYEKEAKEKGTADKTAFQYPGPKPQSKEAALVMIADIVESTAKAKSIESEADIAKIIDDTINHLIKEKQFDESPITLKDLSVIKSLFIPVFGSIYRKRLDYPEPSSSE